MNWKQLKDFCNNLSESELEAKVIFFREDEVITEIEAEKLEEDYYVDNNNKEDGCMPLSIAESIVNDDPDCYPNGILHFTKVYDKGHPILAEIF